jgi:hypothetical protein
MNWRSCKQGFLLLICMLCVGSAKANILATEAYADFQTVGSGNLTFWGAKIYRATLYAPDGEYRPKAPHALEIVYRYAFSREQLAKTSLKEIERIRGPVEDKAAVTAMFASVFVDVAGGDTLIGIHRPGEGARFYSRHTYLGEIANAELAAAFFDIWLNPATRKPALRSQLLGGLE